MWLSDCCALLVLPVSCPRAAERGCVCTVYDLSEDARLHRRVVLVIKGLQPVAHQASAAEALCVCVTAVVVQRIGVRLFSLSLSICSSEGASSFASLHEASACVLTLT